MVDNITAPAVGTVLATDDIGGVHYPRTKISFGADGAATDVASGAPFPVTLGLTDAQLRATPVPVSGTVAVTGTFFQVTQPVSGTVGVSGSVSVTGPLTDTQLRATALPVSGTVGVSGSVAVTGTFWQATQPVSIAGTVAVSGGITDTQLRATPVAVSGTFFQATQPVSAASLPLPTGAATETTLAANLAATQALGAITAIVAVTPSATAFPVSRGLIASANMTADLTVGGVDINGVTLTIGINPIAATKVRAVTGGTVMRVN